MRRSSSGVFPSDLNTKTHYAFLHSAINATCPAHLVCFDMAMQEISGQGDKLWSSLLSRFFQPPITSSFVVPNIFLNTLFLDTLSLCSSFSVRDQVLHPYKRKGKIIQRSLRNNVTNNLIPNIFLTSVYMAQGSRWYTSDFHLCTIDTGIGSPWQQGSHCIVKDICITCHSQEMTAHFMLASFVSRLPVSFCLRGPLDTRLLRGVVLNLPTIVP
jgi:hypothetical protein